MKAAGGQIEDQTAIHLLVEVEVEVVEGLCGSRNCGLFAAPLEQSVTATSEFVGDQAGDEVDGGHGFGLRLAQAGFEHGGHAAQAQLS